MRNLLSLEKYFVKKKHSMECDNKYVDFTKFL